MAVFVINEWLWADSSGDNGLERQREALIFIQSLGASDHQIVVIEGSSFDQKAWGLCKSGDPIVQSIAKLYVTNIRVNSERCLILKPETAAALPDDIASATKLDDHYLIRALLSVGGAILVTTDRPLREAISAFNLSCLSREEFLDVHF